MTPFCCRLSKNLRGPGVFAKENGWLTRCLLAKHRSSRRVSWSGGGGGGGLRSLCINTGYSEPRRDLDPSRELSGHAILDSDWLTTRVTQYSNSSGCPELSAYLTLDSDWLPKAKSDCIRLDVLRLGIVRLNVLR